MVGVDDVPYNIKHILLAILKLGCGLQIKRARKIERVLKIRNSDRGRARKNTFILLHFFSEAQSEAIRGICPINIFFTPATFYDNLEENCLVAYSVQNPD